MVKERYRPGLAVPLFLFALTLGAHATLGAQGGRALRGRVVTPDGGSAYGARIVACARAEAVCTDSATVDADGRFTIWPSAIGPLELRVGATGAYQPVTVGVTPNADWDDVRIVVMPTRWMVTHGAYAGRTVDVRTDAALGRIGSGLNFWRVSRRGESPSWSVAWSTRDRPIPLAFRSTSRDRITTSDSMAFWGLVRELERLLGDTLFRPASEAEIDEGTDGVFVEIDRRLRYPAVTYISWSNQGGAYDGVIRMQSLQYLSDARIVMHELMHALGFGHTAAWPSVMTPYGSIARPTLIDVAHAQLLMAVHRVQEEQSAAYGLSSHFPDK
jgi:hypothetical protein